MTRITVILTELAAVNYGYFPETSFSGLYLGMPDRLTVELLNRDYGQMEISRGDIERIEILNHKY